VTIDKLNRRQNQQRSQVIQRTVNTNGEAYYMLECTNSKFGIYGTTYIPAYYPVPTVVDLIEIGLIQNGVNDPAQEVPFPWPSREASGSPSDPYHALAPMVMGT
jgi:hypothetical protein